MKWWMSVLYNMTRDQALKASLVISALQLLLALLHIWRCNFYRAYFRQKQANMGKDPRAVLREIFPLIWWLL